jgi:hypothetical protein
MRTRTSERWACKPGGYDKLHTKHLGFDGDWPEIYCAALSFDRVAWGNDRRTWGAGALVSMFHEDYILERYWNAPQRYINRLRACAAVMSPDFSLLVGMPPAMAMWQTYRNRLAGWVWQQGGVNVVPAVSWGDESTFAFAFKGIRTGSVVAVSNIGCRTEEQKAFFDAGFEAMQAEVKPVQIVMMSNQRYRHFYAGGNVVILDSFFDQKRKKLWAEGAGKR